MDRRGSSLGTDSQDSDDLAPPGTTGQDCDTSSIQLPKNAPVTPTSSKGIENAKKRLRAFSIQKKTPIPQVVVPKPVNTGSTTVLIGKLSSVKTTPKPEPEPDAKKIPKPPKPGGTKRNIQDSYTALQKRTLADIEDMKRKMELVELGIPLGLICPSSTSEKAMPTKAMPPIKSFLDASKVDEIIREAKKAKAEGREFKFDYQRLLPDYDNPFQRKKEDPLFPPEKEVHIDDSRSKSKSSREKDSRKSDKYDRRHSDHKRDDRDRDRGRDRDRHRYSKRDKDRSKDKEKEKEKVKEKDKEESKKAEVDDKPKDKTPKETDVILNEYLVCDSWSLDNDDKITTASPKVEAVAAATLLNQQIEKAKQAQLAKESLKIKEDSIDSPKPPKIEKLQPVIDSFKFEIDPNEDEALDIFDEDSELDKYNRPTSRKDPYDSPIDLKLFDYDQDMSKEGVIDANDDNFLESVINEIKQENMSDDTSQDKGLVEYDISPKDDYDDSKNDVSQGSVTPELDDRMRDLQSSQHSHYSDGYRSTESYKSAESGYKSIESGYKSSESGYKSVEGGYKSIEGGYKSSDSGYKLKKGGYRSESRQSDNFRLSVEKELDEALEATKMSKSTVDSLETWSFVLKICQPLLFRHDKNKCYKETHSNPKIWYAENPKGCSCVKDRSVVYEELEMCKMSLVDRVYGCDQIPDEPPPASRAWYPRGEAGPARAADWEVDDPAPPASLTPRSDRDQDMCLDREYQKFMESVWPQVKEAKQLDTSRSTTPVRQETRKKKKAEEMEKDTEDKKKAKKIKLSSEGWSQESDIEEEPEKPKKMKQEREKTRKRRHSSTSSSSESDSDDDSKKKKKIKKKGNKKLKAKLAKKRRLSKKLKKQLKEKQKKKKKLTAKVQEVSDDTDEMREKKKEKKAKKKKLMKQKKLQKKKKARAKSSSSSSSSSSSDTDSDEKRKKKIKRKELEARKKKKDKKRKREQSSDSSESEELFDVNVLNNIKTERLTDDEKMAEFSPRRQKPREIINVKELQNDFVGNNIHIKQEKEDKKEELQQKAVEKSVVDTTAEEKEVEPTALDNVEQSTVEKPIITPTVQKTASRAPEIESPAVLPAAVEKTAVEKTAVEKTAVEKTAVEKTAVEKSAVEKTVVEKSSVEVPPTQVRSVEKPQLVQEAAILQTAVVKPLMPSPSIPVPVVQKQQPIFDAVEETKPEVKEQIPEKISQIPVLKQEESHMIPLPEEPQMVQSLDHIVMPPEKPIEAIQSTIKTVPMEYGYDVSSQSELYHKAIEAECEDKFGDAYAQDNYEMYEQMAMAYQSNVANQVSAGGSPAAQTQRIETVVRRRGEIKCDWRAADHARPRHAHHRPSRWGLKPGKANIVLTAGAETEPVPAVAPSLPEAPRQFRIRSVLDPVPRGDATGYDEAYQDMYGASDLLQYGDCFAPAAPAPRASTLDERIDRALRETVLGEVAKDTDDVENDKDIPEKGILVTKSLGSGRASKRVSFADGYTPGQDSDVEEPPVKKKKKSRRYGCAWPCPAAHADHVPLWDALPPPPPPASPPPPPRAAPPLHLLRRAPAPARQDGPIHGIKIDPNSLPPFMPPEPPPGLINFP